MNAIARLAREILPDFAAERKQHERPPAAVAPCRVPVSVT
jgi:hypothetical protein